MQQDKRGGGGREEGRQAGRKEGTQNERRITADGPPVGQSVVVHQIDSSKCSQMNEGQLMGPNEDTEPQPNPRR